MKIVKVVSGKWFFAVLLIFLIGGLLANYFLRGSLEVQDLVVIGTISSATAFLSAIIGPECEKLIKAMRQSSGKGDRN